MDNTRLTQLRGEIDAVDRELLALFLRRMKLCEQVALYKLDQGLPVFQPEREQAILEEKSVLAGPEMAPYARDFFQGLMDCSKQLQRELIDARAGGKRK